MIKQFVGRGCPISTQLTIEAKEVKDGFEGIGGWIWKSGPYTVHLELKKDIFSVTDFQGEMPLSREQVDYLQKCFFHTIGRSVENALFIDPDESEEVVKLMISTWIKNHRPDLRPYLEDSEMGICPKKGWYSVSVHIEGERYYDFIFWVNLERRAINFVREE